MTGWDFSHSIKDANSTTLTPSSEEFVLETGYTTNNHHKCTLGHHPCRGENQRK